jgi:1-acyl-sn-glycerol-3-phosphate acyltransferase
MAHNQFELLKQGRFAPFFWTQALGAFNDNVFKNALIAMVTFVLVSLTEKQESTFIQLSSALFILPFFLFSATSGQLSERFDKARLAQAVKWMEIAIMLIASVGFIYKNIPLLMVCVFGMGLHSTLFGPLKYSLLPQVLKPEELTGGNGLVEMGTFVAILLGTILGANLINIPVTGAYWVAGATILIAVIGLFTARNMPSAPGTTDTINWNPITETLNTLSFVTKNRSVFLSCLGISWFWFYGSVFFTQLPQYSKYVLGSSEGTFTLLLSLFSIGIAVGSLLCEKLSHRTVEIGLVPLGAIGMTVFGADLFFAHPHIMGEQKLALMQVIAQPGVKRVMFDLFMMAIFSGLYIVPLFALVQSRSDKDKVSRVIAANNILNALFMVVAAGLSYVALNELHWTIPQLLLAVAILNAFAAIYIFSLVPEFMMRFVAWVLTKLMYRVEVKGIEENVPDEGPALIVCNHVSYMDALILGGAIPRPTRFVMYYKIFQIPVASWFFKTARAIPIAGAKENMELMQKAFDEVDKALAEGEVVGIFPEGKLTTDGEIAEFKSGVEKILARRAVPVVPVALKGMWASMFSKRDSKLGRLRVPRRIRAHIEVEAGQAIPAEQASAETLEAKVKILRGNRA